jgi:hypothetical protein
MLIQILGIQRHSVCKRRLRIILWSHRLTTAAAYTTTMTASTTSTLTALATQLHSDTKTDISTEEITLITVITIETDLFSKTKTYQTTIVR